MASRQSKDGTTAPANRAAANQEKQKPTFLICQIDFVATIGTTTTVHRLYYPLATSPQNPFPAAVFTLEDISFLILNQNHPVTVVSHHQYNAK